MDVLSPVHAATESGADPLLVVVLGLAGLASAAVFALSLAAYRRRRSISYLLLASAFGLLFGRTAVAGVYVGGLVSMRTHHRLEHVIDLLLALLVIAAIYYARRVERGAAANDPTHRTNSNR
ncbi:DUF7471 family protein [Haloferacaceae archaeon DSL9]